MNPPVVAGRAVAALFLERQWLDRPRARRLTGRSLHDFVHATGGLQVDSVNVVDRAHHLTLWSRFGAYDRAALERLLYRRRVLFESLTHVACFVARDDLALIKRFLLGTPERWSRTTDWHHRHRADIERVASAIADGGPLGSADFEPPPGRRGGAGWWDWKPTTRALDYLWKCGRIAVHSRVHFQKRFAPIAEVLPEYHALEPPGADEALRQRLLRSLAAMGPATVEDLRAYWTWPGIPAPAQREALRALVREGQVVGCRVEGQPGEWWVRREDLAALQRAGRRRAASRGTTLLCPFDSFLWHRGRVERLWGFHYRIEIYVPGPKRQHGYYSLPVLHEGHLVGRVDLKHHREEGVLEARHAHLEPWVDRGRPAPGAAWTAVDREALAHGLADALHGLARHLGAPKVRLARTSPAGWRPALERALRGRAGAGKASTGVGARR
jgi:hypothetical protein